MNLASTTPIKRRFSVAPMLSWTNRYCRYFHRIMTRPSLLYSEMVTTGALLHGERDRFLDFYPEEQPVALQLGGSEPAALAECARMAEDWGYSEVNLNVGCPSDRVQSGRFGACLMATPELVADCVDAMRRACSLPVTVKHRIGIDHLDSDEQLHHFVSQVAAAGCRSFIVHARKAWLQGLSPKQNRDIPPLQYARVYRLKQDFPQLEIIINGGIMDMQQALAHMRQVDGVMLGRAAFHTPWILAQVDPLLYGAPAPVENRHQVIEQLLPLVERECARGVPLKYFTHAILGLFHGRPGAKQWRRYLSERAHLAGAGPEVLQQALSLVPRQ